MNSWRLNEEAGDRLGVLLIGVDDPSKLQLKERELVTIRGEPFSRLNEAVAAALPDIVVYNYQTPPDNVSVDLSVLTKAVSEKRYLIIACNVGGQLEYLREVVQNGRLFYASRNPLPSEQIASLIDASVRKLLFQNASIEPVHDSKVQTRLLNVFLAQLAMQTNLRAARELVCRATLQLIKADNAYCVIVDFDQDVFFFNEINALVADSLASGVCGYSARTGEATWTRNLCGDARYDPGLDNSTGDQEDRLLIQPILCDDGQAIALILARRSKRRMPFCIEDAKLMSRMALIASPFLLSLSDKIRRVEELCDWIPQEMSGGGVRLFRGAALDHYFQREREEGYLQRLQPRWYSTAFWLLLLLIILLSTAFLYHIHRTLTYENFFLP